MNTSALYHAACNMQHDRCFDSLCPVKTVPPLEPGAAQAPHPPGLCLCVLEATAASQAHEPRLAVPSSIVGLHVLRWLTATMHRLTPARTLVMTLRHLACADRAWRDYTREIITWVDHHRRV
jgi:hypothetical protein